MRKSAMLLVCGLMLFLNISQAQDVIIGKESLNALDFPINPANFFNFQYNQFIYKQQWIHSQGTINKIAYYFNGNSTESFDVKIYMGHTSRTSFAGQDWIPYQQLTLVYDGPFTLPGNNGWLEITLQTPFSYNNSDNLVIAIDKNSVDPEGGNGWFSNSIIDDDSPSMYTRDKFYNIDPANPQGGYEPFQHIPNIKITGTLTGTPYLYIYGTMARDISTDPNSTLMVDVETNLSDYFISSLPAWLSATKDLINGQLTFKVTSASGTLNENIRTANIVLSETNVKQDTLLINQYKFESKKLHTAPYYSSAHQFVDFDQDKDLDLVGFFHTVGVNNSDGSFTFQSLSNLPNTMGLSSWADYDNDGDLDFVSMYANYDPASNSWIPDAAKIFRNDGPGIYTDINAGLDAFFTDESEIWSSASWCDYNNDGKTDLLINGPDNQTSASTKLYKNLGNDKFVISGVRLKNIFRGTSDWGDFNKDGLIDLAIHGKDVNGNSVTIIYRNDGNDLFTDIKAGLFGLNAGNVNWGDFDNDGDLDLLANGENSDRNYIKIYRNDGKDVFTDIKADLTIAGRGFYKWNDYDNDGDLDIAGFGDLDRLETVVRYRNDGGGLFVNDFSTVVPGSSDNGITRISNGDYDKDGDLDILVYRMYHDYTKVYRNNSNIPNTTPSVPAGMKSFRNGTRIYLTWNPSSDTETPSKSISYNVRIGTAPGKYDIVAPVSDLSTGFIKIPGIGNSSIDTLFFIDNLPLGTYYWSVQSIDNMYAGSEFSTEQTFTVLAPFSRLSQGIPMLYGASAAWGDYDNDNDMDLFVTGRLTNFDGETTRIYKNNGDTTFTEIILDMQGRYSGSIALGDSDNDNDLDILISGKNTSGQDGAKIIRNDGNDHFTEQPDSFASTQYSSAIWGDVDNDGDLDISVNAGLYRNNGKGSFKEEIQSGQYADMTNNSFADYDNDKDLDFFISCQWVKKELYRNVNGIFSKLTSNYAPLFNGSMDWADYDKDGDMDLLISGLDSLRNNLTLISRNDGNGTFYNIDAEIRGVNSGQAHWGDFDNDGDADIVVVGWSGSRILKVYGNKGNDLFEEIYDHPLDPHDLTEQVNYAIWGDYNNDGNLDFVKNGLIFSNNYNTPNIPPQAPDSLKVTIKGFDAVFSWTDNKNPTGVTYNLRIGTTPGGYEIVSPMADTKTGYRRIPANGNAQNNTSWFIKDLKPAVTYYWSVQAIDAAFKGGPWTPEQSFIMGDIYPDFKADTACLGTSTSFTDLSVSPLGPIISWKWDFGDGENATSQNPEHMYNNPGEYSVTLAVKKDTLTFRRTRKIIIKPSPVADFLYENMPQNRTVISFINKSDTGTLKISKWAWDFGDALKFDGRDPQPHGYSENGLKKVSLALKAENGCSDTTRAEIMICNEPLDKPQILSYGPNVWYMTCSNKSAKLYRWYLDNKLITGATTYFYMANQKTGVYKVEISNEGNCYVPSDEIKIPTGITGIEDPDPFTGVKIYPNPTPGLFTIEMDNNIFGELIIDIYNQIGSKALNIKFEKTTEHFQTQIDLSGQSKGMYVINLAVEKYFTSRKILVK
jgi:PKD repeat protein